MSVKLTDLQRRLGERLSALEHPDTPVSLWMALQTAELKMATYKEITVFITNLKERKPTPTTLKITLHGITEEDSTFYIIKQHTNLSSLSIELPFLAIEFPIDITVSKVFDKDEYDVRELVVEYETRLFKGQFSPLAQAIEKNCSLTHLDLSTIDLSLLNDIMFNRLFEAVKNQERITTVDIGNNKLSAERTKIIEVSLTAAKTQPARTERAAQVLDAFIPNTVSNLILIYFDTRNQFTRKGYDGLLTKDYGVSKPRYSPTSLLSL